MVQRAMNFAESVDIWMQRFAKVVKAMNEVEHVQAAEVASSLAVPVPPVVFTPSRLGFFVREEKVASCGVGQC